MERTGYGARGGGHCTFRPDGGSRRESSRSARGARGCGANRHGSRSWDRRPSISSPIARCRRTMALDLLRAQPEQPPCLAAKLALADARAMRQGGHARRLDRVEKPLRTARHPRKSAQSRCTWRRKNPSMQAPIAAGAVTPCSRSTSGRKRERVAGLDTGRESLQPLRCEPERVLDPIDSQADADVLHRPFERDREPFVDRKVERREIGQPRTRHQIDRVVRYHRQIDALGRDAKRPVVVDQRCEVRRRREQPAFDAGLRRVGRAASGRTRRDRCRAWSDVASGDPREGEAGRRPPLAVGTRPCPT